MTRLGPGDIPRPARVTAVPSGPDEATVAVELPPPPGLSDHIMLGLAKLREPFPPEMIEHLPKPLYKNAWEGKRGSHCQICHGYHVLDDCIHLDYVGHANTTNRLLEADPFWEWEPMAYTAEGLPLFTKNGGLWIRLTVCGVTRIGYGDGKEPKEIIGDAIRNAAMRFGVALDLWSKVDLHADRNLGDGETPKEDSRAAVSGRRSGGQRSGGASATRDERSSGAAVAPDRAPNQDALDALESVCNEYGYSTEYCINRWAKEHGGQHITEADSDSLMQFGATLIEEATPEPADEGVDSAGTGATEGSDGEESAAGTPGTELPADDQPADDGAGSVGEVASGDAAPVEGEGQDLF